MTRTRRGPTPEELRLWAEVLKTVAPLGDRPPAEAPSDTPKPPAKKPPPRADASPPPPPAQKARPTAAPLTTIERRTMSRLVRGSIELDARLDLHGLTQAAAHGRLARFLKQAQLNGARLVLVITGKGRPVADADVGEERGVLRRAVPLWLGSAELRPFVVGFGESAPPHGGSGALYVRIRRAR